jgi:hypothetical protein
VSQLLIVFAPFDIGKAAEAVDGAQLAAAQQAVYGRGCGQFSQIKVSQPPGVLTERVAGSAPSPSRRIICCPGRELEMHAAKHVSRRGGEKYFNEIRFQSVSFEDGALHGLYEDAALVTKCRELNGKAAADLSLAEADLSRGVLILQ